MTAITLRPLDPAETDEWKATFARWHTTFRASFGFPEETLLLERTARSRAEDAPLFALMIDDQRVGSLALRTAEENGATIAFIDDISIAPDHRRQGNGAQALELAREWATGRATQLAATVYAEDPACAGLYRDIPARAQHMVKVFKGKPDLPSDVVVRPMRDDEFDGWKADSVEGYARDIAGSGLLTLDEARTAAVQQTKQLLPDGLATTNMTIEVVEFNGAPAGFVWLRHGSPVEGVTFVYSIDVEPSHRGKGLGKAAMRAAEHTAIDRGSRAMMLNVFAQNAVAIGLYRALDYAVYAQYRSVDL